MTTFLKFLPNLLCNLSLYLLCILNEMSFASFLAHTLLFRLFLVEKSYLVVCGSPEVLCDQKMAGPTLVASAQSYTITQLCICSANRLCLSSFGGSAAGQFNFMESVKLCGQRGIHSVQEVLETHLCYMLYQLICATLFKIHERAIIL